MKFSLNTTIINPENENDIKNAIILLHGYGGDGKDISMLSLSWKRFLKNTVFLCPDAHEICKINPNGFQWFDLNTEDMEYILLESKKAENKIYYRHTGYPGGIKETTPAKMIEKNKSDEIIKLAIKRMIPGGPLGKQQLSNCKIYRDSNHKHEAQNPKIIDIASMNRKNTV